MQSRLSIDRIEFMLYPNVVDYRYIYQRISWLVTCGRAFKWRSAYTTSATVTISDSPRRNIFFQFGYAHGRNYVKVGWVLYSISCESKLRTISLLNSIVPGGMGAVLSAKVGYIEIASDFIGKTPANIEAFDMRLQDGCIWPRTIRPKQTIYVGSRQGTRSICIYDRRMRLRARGIDLPHPELRVEARLRLSGRNILLADIPSIRNPFNSLHLVNDSEVCESLSGRRDAHFLENAERHGLNSALQWSADWDKGRRKDVIKRKALSEWWSPSQVWLDIDNTIAEFMLGWEL